MTVAAVLVCCSSAQAGIVDLLPGSSPVSALHADVLYAETNPGSAAQLILRGANGAGPRRLIASVEHLAGFDLGTDSAGRLVVVYSTCTTGRARCRLVMRSPRFGSSAVIRNANRGGRRNVKPTIWKGRLAWVRQTPRGPTVMFRRLDWPAARPSRRLPGVPPTFPSGSGRRYRTTGRRVDGLDIGPRGLAEIVHFDDPEAGICGHSQVRFLPGARRPARLLDDPLCGLSGQSMSGPSQTGSDISWLVWCGGDPGFCDSYGGAYREDARTRQREIDPIRGGLYTGFAATGDRLYLVHYFNTGHGPCIAGGRRPAGCPLTTQRGRWQPVAAG